MKTPSIAILLLVLAACGDDFPPGSLIERSRLLGARVEVEGDPTRVWPLPGETVAIRWVVAQPDAPAPLAWTFALLAPHAAEPLALVSGAGETPELRVTIPAEVGGASALRLVGVVCAGGTPVVDASGSRCEGDAAEETDASLTLHLAADASAANRSPSIAAGAITLNGQVWAATGEAAPLDGCAAVDGITLLHADDEVELGLAARDGDREPYTAEAPDGGEEARRESLQISSFTTLGELDRQYSIIEGTDPTTAPRVALGWTPPARAEVPAGGRRVRFTLVVRDGRGGLDATTRVACVVP